MKHLGIKGAHPASYPMGTRDSFPGVKQPGREVDHSPPSNVEVKEWVELYFYSSNTPSWRGAQLKAQGLYLYFTAVSRPALGPTQPPMQWVQGTLSLGVKRPGREADHSPPSSADVKEWVELYFYSPVRLHGMVLS
jgi:hypothetical protein